MPKRGPTRKRGFRSSPWPPRRWDVREAADRSGRRNGSRGASPHSQPCRFARRSPAALRAARRPRRRLRTVPTSRVFEVLEACVDRGTASAPGSRPSEVTVLVPEREAVLTRSSSSPRPRSRRRHTAATAAGPGRAAPHRAAHGVERDPELAGTVGLGRRKTSSSAIDRERTGPIRHGSPATCDFAEVAPGSKASAPSTPPRG